MAGTPNGTSATADGCAPYWPVVGQGGQWLCVTSLQSGVRVTADPAGVGQCFGAGLAFRNNGSDTYARCIDPAAVVTNDYTAFGDATGKAIGRSVCSARGMSDQLASVSNTSLVQCSGVAASQVSDSATQAKLDALSAKVDAFAAANHADLGKVQTAASPAPAPSATTVTATGTSQAVDFPVGPVLQGLFYPALFALLMIACWTFWKKVAR